MPPKVSYGKEIDEAIEKARKRGEQADVTALDGAHVYAYPRGEGEFAWGVNRASDGFNILRGIRKPDGSDCEVM
jgi:hypothetical protein